VLCVALFACKKKEAPSASTSPPTVSTSKVQYDELVPKVKARLDKLAAIAAKAKTEPKVKKEKPFATKLADSDFVLLGDKWAADVNAQASPDELELKDSTLSLAKYALNEASPKESDVKYMQESLETKYVAVIRPRSTILPVIRMAEKKFTPGELNGDLLLFDLENQAIVGRYLLGITNSDELKWFEGKPEQDWKDESKRDLVENVRNVIGERLRQERDSSGDPN
jgi:hypothetical protein